MENQNMNDPENNTNKRLGQDDVEKQNAAYGNGVIAVIVFILVLIGVLAFVYFTNNKSEPVVEVPVTNTMQQAPATEVPALAAPAAEAPAPAAEAPAPTTEAPATAVPVTEAPAAAPAETTTPPASDAPATDTSTTTPAP